MFTSSYYKKLHKIIPIILQAILYLQREII